MAHAYTTSRGKNKKAKLNKRMDKAQNSERSIKKTVVDTKFDGPKTNVFTIGRISGGNNSSSSSSRAIIDPRQAAIAAINPPILKCNNPNCKKKTISKLSQCSGCELVSYCGRDCQAEDWKAHKTICKQQQMQSKKLETTINEQLSNLTLHNDSDSEFSDNENSIENDLSDDEDEDGEDDTKLIETYKNQSVLCTDIESDDGYIIVSSTTET